MSLPGVNILSSHGCLSCVHCPVLTRDGKQFNNLKDIKSFVDGYIKCTEDYAALDKLVIMISNTQGCNCLDKTKKLICDDGILGCMLKYYEPHKLRFDTNHVLYGKELINVVPVIIPKDDLWKLKSMAPTFSFRCPRYTKIKSNN